MRYLVIILWFSFNAVLLSQPSRSIIDSIKQEKVSSTWTSEGEYFISDYKANIGGTAREYDGMLFYKYKYGAIFIEKRNGNVFQKMWQSLEGSQDEGGYTYNIRTGNWDLSPTDTNKVLVGEYGAETGEESRIISYYNGTVDTLYKWENERGDYYRNQNGEYYFYAISDSKFLVHYDAAESEGPNKYYRRVGGYVNTEKDLLIFLGYPSSVNNINLASFEINAQNTRIISSSKNKDSYSYDKKLPDTYNFFEIGADSLKNPAYITIRAGSWFKSFIDDNRFAYRNADSLLIFNIVTNKVESKFFIKGNTNVAGNYQDTEKQVSTFVLLTDTGKRLLSIHIPTQEVVMDKIVDAPYLGKPMTDLEEGYQLSIGDNGYLYKHKNDIFKYDSLTVDFTFDNSINSIVEFQAVTYGAVTEWKWEYGDGKTSQESNPTHQYDKPGDYEVILSVTNAFGNTKTTSKTITVEDKLNASFDFGKFSGNAPLTIEFNNYSSQNAKRYIWNFGDGTYSNEKNATHIYTANGTYTVSLTVLDENENFHTHLSAKKIIVTD